MAKPKNPPLASATDYPPLAKWLEGHGAREAWRAVAPSNAAVACYVVGTTTVLALLRPDGAGWELYTTDGGNDIAVSLADAHARVTGTVTDSVDAAITDLVRSRDNALRERDEVRRAAVQWSDRAIELENALTIARAELAEAYKAVGAPGAPDADRIDALSADAKGYARKMTEADRMLARIVAERDALAARVASLEALASSQIDRAQEVLAEPEIPAQPDPERTPTGHVTRGWR